MFRLDAIDSRARRAAGCATLSLLVGCGDSTAPTGESKLFRLTTVNAQSLPYRCPPGNNAPPCTIAAGELLLRSDATFTLAIDGILFLMEGTYVRGRDSLMFTVPNGDPRELPFRFSAASTADSIGIVFLPPPIALGFRSSAMPPATVSASYLLTEANGRSGQPVILSDTVIRGARYVSRVDFDSLVLKDGIFFRQHRAESSTAYLAAGDTVRSENEGISYGSFTSDGGWVVLRRYYWALLSQTPTDSFAITGTTLARTTRFSSGNLVEHYSRLR